MHPDLILFPRLQILSVGFCGHRAKEKDYCVYLHIRQNYKIRKSLKWLWQKDVHSTETHIR